MSNSVKDIQFEAGFITVTYDSGPPVKLPVADMLRAADIPVLTIEKVVVLSRLAKLFAIVLKTLIAQDVLGEAFDDDYDLDFMISVLEDELAIEDGF